MSSLSIVCFKFIGIVEEGIPKSSEKRMRIESRYDFYMHEEHEIKLKSKPWGIGRYPEVGIFATRFPHRPNPLGVSVVELVSVESPIIKVKGLDAYAGTPILNIKPYDHGRQIENIKIPEWLKQLKEKIKEKPV